jgi:octaprenyl-diphosphate synthase
MTLARSAPEAPFALADIERELDAVEAWLQAEFRSGPPTLAPLLAHASRFRGKRVRAAQILLVGRACGGATHEHALLAGVVELIHAATLAHDDVLDEARQRRDLDCLHVAWGNSAAILLGDWIYARAFAHCTAMPDRTASQVLAAATARVCAGEIHQNLTRGRFDLAEADYLAQVDGKTAALFQAAGRLAAHAAGAPPAAVEAAARHGMLAGRAFQIADDLLDLEGQSAHAGKSLGTDWARGKMTLPLIRLRDTATPDLRRRFEAAFAARIPLAELRGGELAAPLAAALEDSRAEVRGLLAQACAAAGELPDPDGRRALAELTRWFGNRSR